MNQARSIAKAAVAKGIQVDLVLQNTIVVPAHAVTHTEADPPAQFIFSTV